MEGAIGRERGQHLGDGADPSLLRCLGCLEDECGRPHSEDHPVATSVERDGRVLDGGIGGRRTRGEEAGADPTQEVVGGGVVGRDHDDPPAATGADPVLRYRDGLSGAGAGGVDLRVRPPGTDDLGELRVPHGQDAEQEATIEHVRVSLDLGSQRGDPSVELGGRGGGTGSVGARQAGAHRLEGGELLSAGLVGVVVASVAGEGIQSGKGGGEDHAGVVPKLVGEAPAFREPSPDVRRLVLQDQRDARVAERVEAGRDGHARRALQGGDPLRVDAELPNGVECLRPCCELDDVGGVVDGLEAAAPVIALDQTGDVLIEDGVPNLGRDGLDALLTTQQAPEVGGIEDPFGTGYAQRGTRDDLRSPPPHTVGVGLDRAVEELGDELPELRVVLG